VILLQMRLAVSSRGKRIFAAYVLFVLIGSILASAEIAGMSTVHASQVVAQGAHDRSYPSQYGSWDVLPSVMATHASQQKGSLTGRVSSSDIVDAVTMLYIPSYVGALSRSGDIAGADMWNHSSVAEPILEYTFDASSQLVPLTWVTPVEYGGNTIGLVGSNATTGAFMWLIPNYSGPFPLLSLHDAVSNAHAEGLNVTISSAKLVYYEYKNYWMFPNASSSGPVTLSAPLEDLLLDMRSNARKKSDILVAPRNDTRIESSSSKQSRSVALVPLGTPSENITGHALEFGPPPDANETQIGYPSSYTYMVGHVPYFWQDGWNYCAVYSMKEIVWWFGRTSVSEFDIASNMGLSTTYPGEGPSNLEQMYNGLKHWLGYDNDNNVQGSFGDAGSSPGNRDLVKSWVTGNTPVLLTIVAPGTNPLGWYSNHAVLITGYDDGLNGGSWYLHDTAPFWTEGSSYMGQDAVVAYSTLESQWSGYVYVWWYDLPFLHRHGAVAMYSYLSHTVNFYTDPSSGTITVDGVTKSNGEFLNYFENPRVHVVANPPSGYQFSYWETSGVSVDSTSSADTYMTVSNNGWLKAHFVRPFDFSLSNSGGITVTQGGSGSNTITATLTSGSTQSVSLSCTSGLPSGASCSFNPQSGNPTFTSTLTISTSSSTPTGSYTITVTGTGGGKSHTTQFTLTVNAPSPGFDFSLSNSGGITVTQGGSGSNTIYVNLVSGTTQSVSLSCTSGLPSGASCSFNPASGNPTFTSTLTISTSSSTPAGSYTITVTGSGGGKTRTTQFTLTVNAPPPSFDFSLSNSGGITVTQGGSGSNTITVTLLGGSTQSVSLSCTSGLPSGASCSFSPASGNPTFTSTLTVSTSSSMPTGSSTVTVTGTGGGKSHTTQFTLTVTGEVELSYDDDDIDYGVTGGYPWAAAVRFTPPRTPFLVSKIKVNAWWSESGSGTFYLEIWDANRKELYQASFRYDQYFKDYPTWVIIIPVSDVVVYGDFYVVVAPNPGGTSQAAVRTVQVQSSKAGNVTESAGPTLWISFDTDPPFSGRSYGANIATNTIDSQLSDWDFMIRSVGIELPPFDGDGLSDLVIYRGGASGHGNWYSCTSSSSYASVQFIAAFGMYDGDIPLLGNFDGDGEPDLFIYRGGASGHGSWYVRTSSGGYASATLIAAFGLYNGDVPLLGDFDGDGLSDLVIYRGGASGHGNWYVRRSSTAYSSAQLIATFGMWDGDVPLLGNFDGDGKADLVIYRGGSTWHGNWYVRKSSDSYSSATLIATFGIWDGDIPLLGDFDGDGKADLFIYRGGSTWHGNWYVRKSSDGYSTTELIAIFGLYSGDVPLLGNFDADGKADLFIYRGGSTWHGNWYVRKSSGGYASATLIATFGLYDGDKPLLTD